eukprot:s3705_g5.t1
MIKEDVEDHKEIGWSALDQQTGALRWGPVNASIGKVFSCSTAAPQLLLCGGSDGLAALDVRSGALRFTLELKELGEIWSMVYDADTRLLFCGGNKERVWTAQGVAQPLGNKPGTEGQPSVNLALCELENHHF